MFDFLFKVWWMIAVLPYIIFLEGDKRFSDFLRKKNIYSDWDIWHSFVVVLVLLLVILWMRGYR